MNEEGSLSNFGISLGDCRTGTIFFSDKLTFFFLILDDLSINCSVTANFWTKSQEQVFCSLGLTFLLSGWLIIQQNTIECYRERSKHLECVKRLSHSEEAPLHLQCVHGCLKTLCGLANLFSSTILGNFEQL